MSILLVLTMLPIQTSTRTPYLHTMQAKKKKKKTITLYYGMLIAFGILPQRYSGF